MVPWSDEGHKFHNDSPAPMNVTHQLYSTSVSTENKAEMFKC